MKVFSALSVLALSLACHTGSAQGPDGFKVSQTFKIGSPGGWDYIAVGPDQKIYVSHGTQVNILDANSGDSVGVIPNTTGVHGIAFDGTNGYTSNGGLNTVTVFDIKTSAVLKQIPVGQKPDAIMYDRTTKKIITCNGKSNDLSIIDPATSTVVATVPLNGKPETAVSDEAGKLYINIEDKNEIAVVDIASAKVLNHWSIAPGDGPTGLAIDVKTRHLFAGCDKQLIVIDVTNGHIVDKLPIGDGCDGVAFDNQLMNVYASCGEGVLTIIREKNDGTCKVLGNLPTKRSARTIAVDENTHKIYLPAADLGKAAAGQRPKSIPGTFGVLVVSRG